MSQIEWKAIEAMTEYPCDIMATRYSNWGHYTISLEEWIEMGPGLRIGGTIGEIHCAEDGRELPRSVVPLQYRNDYLSKFLVAVRLFEYPWRENYEMIEKYYGSQMEIVDSTMIGSTPYRLYDSLSESDMDIVITLPPEWHCVKVKSFNRIFLVFTNDRTFLNSDEDFRLESFSNDTDFLFGTFDTYTKNPLSLDDYIPDKNYGEEISRGSKQIDDYAIQFVAHRLKDKPLALISVVREIPYDNVHSLPWKNHRNIHLIGVSNIGGYEKALQVMIDCARTIDRAE